MSNKDINEETGRELYMLGFVGGLFDKPILLQYADDPNFQKGFLDGSEERLNENSQLKHELEDFNE